MSNDQIPENPPERVIAFSLSEKEATVLASILDFAIRASGLQQPVLVNNALALHQKLLDAANPPR